MASIKKRGNKWFARVSKRKNGKLIQVNESFRTKLEAEIWARETETTLANGITLSEAKKSFYDYFTNWYQTYKENTVSEATQRNYEITKKTIKRYFNDMPLNQIDEQTYKKFIIWFAFGKKDEHDNYVERPHNRETVDKVNVHCKSCFRKAYKLGHIKFNPAEDVKSVGKITQKQDNLLALDEKEMRSVITKLREKYDKNNPNIVIALLLVSFAFGPRFSEISGLTWDCVYNDGRLKINKAWDFRTHNFKETKNHASNRTITIDDYTLRLLNDLHSWQISNHVYYKNLVFIDKRLSLYSNNGVNKALKLTLKELNISKPTFTHHNIRHTHITWLLNHKKNLKYVSRRAGHENIMTTLNTYNHVLDAIEQSEDTEVKVLMLEQYCKTL